MQLITLLFTIAITGASAQTQQHGVVAVGGAPSSPAQPVTSLPGACQVGEQLFKTNAPAGNNLYGCTATNTWTLLAGGVGGSGGLAQFDMTKTSATIFTLCSTCASNTPGVVMNNGIQAAVITAPATGTISGANASGTILTYLANGNVPTIAHNLALTITPSAGWTVTTGVVTIPVDVVATFWAITVTNNVIDTIAPATMDIRGVYNQLLPGSGGVSIAKDPISGAKTISVAAPSVAQLYYFPACSAISGVGTSLWDTGANAASPGAITIGAANNPCGLSFSNSGTDVARFYHPLGPSYSGTVKLVFDTESQGGAGVANVLSVRTFCMRNGTAFITPAFNAAQTVTITSVAAADQMVQGTIASLTMTGCLVRDTLIVEVTKTDALAALRILRATLEHN